MVQADTEVLGFELAEQHENGGPEVPSYDAANDLEQPAAAGDSDGAAEQPEEGPSSRIYLVRVPRPPVDDTLVKNLQADFQAHVAKIKAINAKLGAKREDLRELRRQMGVGRQLREGSQPEFEQKLNRLKELRNERNETINRINTIKALHRGLECRSEQELEARIKQLEDHIHHDSLPLREEKLVIQQISKLQGQRVQMRGYDAQQAELAALESESAKVKALIAELEGEFTVIKGEREQAGKIVADILAKVQAAERDLKELEDEQAEAVRAKNDAVAALDKARSDMNGAMQDYRDNRSFSLRVRDLVAAGQVEEARTLAAQQVDEVMARLASDKAYAKEYHSLWAQQRKYVVSELLPESSTSAKPRGDEPQGRGGPGGRGGAGGPGGRGGRGERAAPPKPQGAEKAKAIIDSLMSEAAKELAGKGTRSSRAYEPDSDDEPEEDLAPAAPPAAAAASAPKAAEPAPKPLPKPAPKPAEPPVKVEQPVLRDQLEFKLPDVVKASAAVSEAVSEADKAKVREEQARKAAEAEERKRKKGELAKKRAEQAADAKKKALEAAKAAQVKQQQAAAMVEEATARQRAAEEEAAAAAAVAAAAAAAAAASSADEGDKPRPKAKAVALSGLKPRDLPIAKSQVVTKAKTVKAPESLPKRLKKLLAKYQIAIVVVIVLLITLLLAVMVYY